MASASYAIYIHPWSIPSYEVVNPHDNYIITILHLTFFIGIGILVYISRYITNKKIIHTCVVIGGLTYPLYLLHQTIGNTFIRYCMNRFDLPGTPVAYTFEVLIILIAYVVYRYDKIMRGWLQKKLITKEPSTHASM
jgi:peptidoglycan/LPS O-acetylase OafA/YrhL